MTIRTFLIVIFTAGVWASPAFAQTEQLKTAINPAHLTDTTQFGYSQAAIASPSCRNGSHG